MAHGRSTDSIGSFHDQLRVLERTGTTLMEPAHRLGTALPSADDSVRGGLSAPTAPGDSRRALAVVPFGAPSPAGDRVLQGPRPALRRPDAFFHPVACKRRRDVLVALLCALVGTGLIGAIPGLHSVLVATGVVAVAAVLYLGLLVRLRTQAVERENKLRYLPRTGERETSIVIRRAASH
jgi:hypothetical protein